MKKLLAIGEALIDFIPTNKGCELKDVEGFVPHVGGAPANVCAAYRILGGPSTIITMLGDDPFGDKIVDEFTKYHLNTEAVLRTAKANTSLAFVSLKNDGDREFSFYRKPGADMLMEASDIKESWFNDSYALHFCSVSLGDFPMKKAHLKAIEIAEKNNLLISFDPNIRKPLWNDLESLKQTVLDFIPFAHIVKISEDELEFITGLNDINEAKKLLFKGNVKVIVYTMGKNGSKLIFKDREEIFDPGFKCECPADTTGAGDGFIGALLYKLSEQKIDKDNLVNADYSILHDSLRFANLFSSMSVMKKGAISSYPTLEEVKLKGENKQ